MFALDRLKVVMPLEHVTVLDESVFTTTRHGQILKMNYSQKVPALLNIKIDYENSEAVIEFTGKILGERYKELIRLTNIKQCIDNINVLRIVKINREEFIHAEVLKCDPTIDVETDDIPALTKFIKNSIDNYDLYSVQPKNTKREFKLFPFFQKASKYLRKISDRKQISRFGKFTVVFGMICTSHVPRIRIPHCKRDMQRYKFPFAKMYL